MYVVCFVMFHFYLVSRYIYSAYVLNRISAIVPNEHPTVLWIIMYLLFHRHVVYI